MLDRAMHEIRLRKPWIKTVDDSSTGFRVDVPELAGFDLERSVEVARYDRNFNRPSGLDDSRVYLRITGWQGTLTSLILNQTSVPLDAEWTQIDLEIASLLESHNQLSVTLRGTPAQPPRLSGEVTLAIDDSSVS
jgi:hypothetical protein